MSKKRSYHLKSNDSTANDSHLLWHFLERNSASACDDLLLIDGQTREGCRLRASGNEDVFAADGGLATFDQVDSDSMFILERTSALDVFNIVLLEKELDSLGEAGNGRILRLHHGREVELDIANFNTAAFCVVENLVVKMRVVEERF